MTTVNFRSLEQARPMLLAIAAEMIGKDFQSKLGASDIVQQTMLEAFLHLDQGASNQPAHLDGWLRTLLINNVKDAARFFRNRLKRSVRRECQLIVLDSLESSTSPPEDSLISEEQIEQMQESMQRIPEAHRQVLTWRFFEQRSCAEIGKLIGRHESAVRMMVHRSLDRVRREMRRNENPVSR